MKRKIAVLLATIGLLATLGTVLAASWYFSAPQTTTSVQWIVTMNTIPATMPMNQIYNFQGTVALGTTPQSGVQVTLFLNGTTTGLTGTTSGAGTWTIPYNNTQPAGTTMIFEAGVFQ